MSIINLKEVANILPNFFNTKETVNIVTEPGIGTVGILKNEIEKLLILEAEKFWSETKMSDFNIKNHYSFIDGSTFPTEEIVIPYIDGSEKPQWSLIPELKKVCDFLENKENDDLTYVVFVDEFSSLNKNNQQMMMDFIQLGLLPDGSKVDLKRVWFVLTETFTETDLEVEEKTLPFYKVETTKK